MQLKLFSSSSNSSTTYGLFHALITQLCCTVHCSIVKHKTVYCYCTRAENIDRDTNDIVSKIQVSQQECKHHSPNNSHNTFGTKFKKNKKKQHIYKVNKFTMPICKHHIKDTQYIKVVAMLCVVYITFCILCVWYPLR